MKGQFGQVNMSKQLTISTARVLGNIQKIYANRERAALEIAKAYVAMIMNEFVATQAAVAKDEMGAFWHNRTFKAASQWYARAYRIGTNIGFYVSYGNIEYDNALEAYSKSLQITMGKYAQPFLADMERLYSGSFD